MEGADRTGAATAAGKGQAERGSALSPPTPVRAVMGPASTPAEEVAAPPPPDVHVAVDGVRWAVRTLGRSGTASAPLLLLGFFHPDDPPEPRREALVVARRLEELTELQLEAAWRASGPYVPPGTRRPFFPEIAARGVKDG